MLNILYVGIKLMGYVIGVTFITRVLFDELSWVKEMISDYKTKEMNRVC